MAGRASRRKLLVSLLPENIRRGTYSLSDASGSFYGSGVSSRIIGVGGRSSITGVENRSVCASGSAGPSGGASASGSGGVARGASPRGGVVAGSGGGRRESASGSSGGSGSGFLNKFGNPMSGGIALLTKIKDTIVEVTQQREPPPSDDCTNPITAFFDIRDVCTTAGPGLIWTVHNAYRKSDNKFCSVFLFDKRDAEKVFRTKKKEKMFLMMKKAIKILESNSWPRTLEVVHKLEEGPNTFAFATEGVIASLHHIFAWHATQRKILTVAPEEELVTEVPTLTAETPLSLTTSQKKLPTVAPEEELVTEVPTLTAETPLSLTTSQKKLPTVAPEEELVTEVPTLTAETPLSLTESIMDTEPVCAFPPNLFVTKEDEVPPYVRPPLPEHAKEYFFMDVELRYGFLQIIDALNFIHYEANMVHCNVCPQNIILTSKGVWKLIGMEFLKTVQATEDPSEMMNYASWNIKYTDACQPNLNYSAPEIQVNAQINILSDMYSFGMIIFAIYNCGKPLIEANDDPVLYLKQMEGLDKRVLRVLPRMPKTLQEAAQRMLTRDPNPRPTTALLPLTKYFSTSIADCTIRALQFLDEFPTKTTGAKVEFLKGIGMATVDQIPKKMRVTNVFESLKPDLRNPEVLAVCLDMVIYIIKDESDDTYTDIIYPAMKNIYTKAFLVPKNASCIVPYLNGMHILLNKCDKQEHIREELLPILMVSLESSNKEILGAAVHAFLRCLQWMDDDAIINNALPCMKPALERYYNDYKMSCTVLTLLEIILDKLDKDHLSSHVVPALLIMKLGDANVMERVVNLYNIMVTEEKFGLPHTLMASKMLPSIVPHVLNKNFEPKQFQALMEMLYDMLDRINYEQRILIEEHKNRPKSPPLNLARRQVSIDEPAPAFCIPNLRVERKVSSAEEMARKNSAAAAQPTNSATSVTNNIRRISQWFFGSNNSTNSNNMAHGQAAGPSAAPTSSAASNFLRVVNVLPNRRLSDNTLMTPKIKIAPSCASSPGGTPGGSQGLPTRRHSSIGTQERRGSHVNLSPPTVYHGRGRGGGSGSSLSVPANSHPAGGSLPGSTTQYLDPSRGSGHSVHSAQSAIAARASLSARGSPMRSRRLSVCPPSASTGAAAASAAGSQPTFTHVTVTPVRRLPFRESRTPPSQSPRHFARSRARTNSVASAVDSAAHSVAHNVANMAEAVASRLPSYSDLARRCPTISLPKPF